MKENAHSHETLQHFQNVLRGSNRQERQSSSFVGKTKNWHSQRLVFLHKHFLKGDCAVSEEKVVDRRDHNTIMLYHMSGLRHHKMLNDSSSLDSSPVCPWLLLSEGTQVLNKML
jgi:hypothetical protein